MLNIRRIQLEAMALGNRYGRHNIVVSPQFAWIKIAGFPLKADMYNLSAITIAIMIPAQFDLASISECYVDRDLRFCNGQPLPHMWNSVQYERDGYIWLCFHPPAKHGFGILDFIETLRTFFTDPIRYVKAAEG